MRRLSSIRCQLDNVRCHIVDHGTFELQPIGVFGELLLGGPQVAQRRLLWPSSASIGNAQTSELIAVSIGLATCVAGTPMGRSNSLGKLIHSSSCADTLEIVPLRGNAKLDAGQVTLSIEMEFHPLVLTNSRRESAFGSAASMLVSPRRPRSQKARPNLRRQN